MAVQTELSSASLTSSCRNNSSSSAESASGTGSPIGWRAADLWVYKSWGISWSRRVTRLYNVGCWLVASFGIVAIFSHIILNTCIVFRFHYCGKKVWETIFFWKKTACNCWEADFFQKRWSSAKFLLSQVLQIPQLHRQKNSFNYIDFNCSQLKSLLKVRICFSWEEHIWLSTLKRVQLLFRGGPYTNQEPTLICSGRYCPVQILKTKHWNNWKRTY